MIQSFFFSRKKTGFFLTFNLIAFSLFLLSCTIPTTITFSDKENHFTLKAAELKVLSLNVWALPPPFGTKVEERLKELVNHLNSFDIVLLQEAFHPQSTHLKESAGFPYEYHHSNQGFITLSSGLSVLSRYPIQEIQFEKFTDCIGLECLAEKGVLFARLNHPQLGNINIFNTHFHSSGGNQDPTASTKIREDNNNRILMKFIASKELNYPTIIAGDFNMTDSSSEYKDLLKHTPLIDTYIWNQFQKKEQSFLNTIDEEIEGYTYDGESNQFAIGSPRRVDYIFMLDSKEFYLEVLSSEVIFKKPVNHLFLSDHFGVSTNIRISPLSSQ